MKYILLVLFSSIFAVSAKALSVNIDSCGLDTERKLNKWEIEYFKESLKQLRDIDLENKAFAFAYGNFGHTVVTKKYYFEEGGRDRYRQGGSVSNILIKLNDEEKQQSGGYDYIIISWSKTLPAGKSRKKLIERVRENSEGKS